MNNPVQVLFDEHEVIRTVIDAARKSRGSLTDDAQYEEQVRLMVDFFRRYGDQYHHHKEEEILFPAMCKKNELLEGGVIQEMLDNHNDFREMLASVIKYLDEKNYMRADQQLNYYCEALLDHIAVENDEVFQMAESLLSETEMEDMYYRFADCDRELGDESKKQLAESADMINKEIEKIGS